MRAVVSRCLSASVTVDGSVVGSLPSPGLLVLLGIAREDGPAEVGWMARKLWGLRILDGELSASDAAAPLLVVFGKLDRLIPWQQAERVAAEAPNAELVMYPDGNHVCNNLPYKYRPLVADWMSEHLRAT